jgi:chemosensory pili system protein ChpA (sensor histidine kinase/response regulator)
MNPGLDPEIAQVFVDEARSYLVVLEDPGAALADQLAAAHAFKTSADLVGEDDLRATIEEIERLLHAHEGAAAREAARRAASRLDTLAADLPPRGAVAEADEGADDAGALGADSGFDADETRLLRSFFRDEALEHLEAIAGLLGRIENAPGRRELIDEVMRKTHTLKGSAATVGMRAASEGAHRLEDAMAQVRAGRLPMTPATTEALIAAVDLVRAIAQADAPALARQRLEHLRAHLAALIGVPGPLPIPTETTPPALRPLAGAGGTAAPAAPSAAHASSPSSPTLTNLPDAVPTPIEGGSSGRIRVARITQPNSSSGPHPEPPADDTRSDDDNLFEDRRTPDRRHEPHILRVDAARVDSLMDAVGELVFDRTRLERRGQELRTLSRELSKTRAALRMLLGPLRAATISAKSGQAPPLQAVVALSARISDLEAELATHAAALARTTSTLLDDTEALRRTSSQLQNGLTQVRMTSVRTLFSRLAGPLRESARRAGKRVELATSGDDAELDKTVVEQIVDPLVQLLRNAVVHGIEAAEVRARAHKPPAGRITMAARHQGDSVYLDVSDDGGGIDVARLRMRLVALGRMSATQAAQARDERVIASIFAPGISTRDEADELAGRGVGLDVVRESIARLGGEITVASSPGEGTRFTIRLPLTTAISQALLFRVGGQVYAVPSVHVLETTAVEVSTPSLPSAIALHGEIMPLVSLHELLGAPPPSDARKLPAVVLRFADRRLAATCDKVLGPREIVVKSIGPLLAPLGIYAGATISGAGKVQLILDPAALTQLAYPAQALGGDAIPQLASEGGSSTLSGALPGITAMPSHGPPPPAVATAAHALPAGPVVPQAPAPATTDPGAPPRGVGRDSGTVPVLRPGSLSGQMAQASLPRRILVADDSKSVRESVVRMLSAAGYIVDAATDGVEAWDMLQDVDYDLLVTDLEMPRLGGFELIDKARHDQRFGALPILVISSKSAEPQRHKAAQLGASGFQPKPVSRPALLEQVASLLR